ncbi:MAG: hypothetical protein CYPHOPRED_002841, partial [Cyphobasidiales sp. Tagirdzhanova-0007]
MYLAERVSAHAISYSLVAAGPGRAGLTALPAEHFRAGEPLEEIKQEEAETDAGVYERIKTEYEAFSHWLARFNNLSAEQRSEKRWQEAAVSIQQQLINARRTLSN